jgi:hypothetical protein
LPQSDPIKASVPTDAQKDRAVYNYDYLIPQESDSDSYVYLHSDLRPWDPMNDLQQFEKDFIICTRWPKLYKTFFIIISTTVSLTSFKNRWLYAAIGINNARKVKL